MQGSGESLVSLIELYQSLNASQKAEFLVVLYEELANSGILTASSEQAQSDPSEEDAE